MNARQRSIQPIPSPRVSNSAVKIVLASGRDRSPYKNRACDSESAASPFVILIGNLPIPIHGVRGMERNGSEELLASNGHD